MKQGKLSYDKSALPFMCETFGIPYNKGIRGFHKDGVILSYSAFKELQAKLAMRQGKLVAKYKAWWCERRKYDSLSECMPTIQCSDCKGKTRVEVTVCEIPKGRGR